MQSHLNPGVNMPSIPAEIMLKTLADQQAEIIALKKLVAELTHVKPVACPDSRFGSFGFFERLSGSA